MCNPNYLFLFLILWLFFQKDETKKDKTICILTNFHKICIRQALKRETCEAHIIISKVWNMLK